MSDDPLPYGATLGAFLLEGRVGQGGMGTVYRARNRITGEARAVKVVRPEHAANDELRARFVREMRLASAVDHPNVVRVYEPSMEGDTLILPMEFVEASPSGRTSVPATAPLGASAPTRRWRWRSRSVMASLRSTRSGSSTATSSRPT
ncbi:MAG: protein kinase [Deltaproteobacteria bacterium]|nr:protein kinase [Deltaproteobacteria bacterium]